MEDHTLITLIQRGNKEAYRALVERYQGMVYNIAYKILLDEDDAKDAAQEAFIKAYSALPSFKGQSKFSTWLYRIAYTTTISRTRKKNRRADIEQAGQIEANYQDQAEYTMEQDDQAKHLHTALGQLPEQDRLLLTLYYLDELPMEEVAEIAGLDMNNTKVKMHRARKKLADTLKKLLPEETHNLV
jgi:RNA polymerase sigma-70 factor (ECF subfamily)